MIGKTILNYKIRDKLPSTVHRTSGEGGMGVVYKTEVKNLKRTVAIKFLTSQIASDEERKRFKRVAKATGALNHPNIITSHEIGEIEGRAYIAMEYVKGKSFKDKIADKEFSIASTIDLPYKFVKRALHVKQKALLCFKSSYGAYYAFRI